MLIMDALRSSVTAHPQVLVCMNGIDAAVRVDVDRDVVISGCHGSHVEFDGDRVGRCQVRTFVTWL